MIIGNAWNILIRCQNHADVEVEVPVNAGDSMHDVTIHAQFISVKGTFESESLHWRSTRRR